jgi:hypothetical protein
MNQDNFKQDLNSEGIKKAADEYVTNHQDSEVRRMYGHHVRTFIDGANYSKDIPSQEKRIQELEEGLRTLLNALGDDKISIDDTKKEFVKAKQLLTK